MLNEVEERTNWINKIRKLKKTIESDPGNFDLREPVNSLLKFAQEGPIEVVVCAYHELNPMVGPIIY